VLRAQGFLGDVLDLDRLADDLFRQPHGLERTQSLGTAELDDRIRRQAGIQRGNRKPRNVLERDKADLVVSAAVNLRFGILRVETESWTQPHFREERRLQDRVRHPATLQPILDRPLRALQREIDVNVRKRDQHEVRDACSAGGIDEIHLSLAVDALDGIPFLARQRRRGC